MEQVYIFVGFLEHPVDVSYTRRKRLELSSLPEPSMKRAQQLHFAIFRHDEEFIDQVQFMLDYSQPFELELEVLFLGA